MGTPSPSARSKLCRARSFSRATFSQSGKRP